MPVTRPTLTALIDRITADLESRLPTAQLRRSNAKVYARVLAAASHELHGFIEYLSRQLFFDTAESEYLDRWASIFGLTRKPATRAAGRVTFTKLAEGATVPEGTLLQTDAGITYQTTTALSGAEARVEALTAGVAGNVLPGDVLRLVSPVEGIYSEALTDDGIAGGADAESDDALRTRLLARVQETPHAGAAADYEQWALEVPGVTRAWVYPLEGGPGTVFVRFVCDGERDIVPTSAMISRVQEHIDGLRPVTAMVTVAGPTTKAVPFTITNLEPESDAVKQAIQGALISLFKREGSPGGRIYLSHIRAAISAAAGETDHTLVTPSEDVVMERGVLPTVGDVKWQ